VDEEGDEEDAALMALFMGSEAESAASRAYLVARDAAANKQRAREEADALEKEHGGPLDEDEFEA